MKKTACLLLPLPSLLTSGYSSPVPPPLSRLFPPPSLPPSVWYRKLGKIEIILELQERISITFTGEPFKPARFENPLEKHNLYPFRRRPHLLHYISNNITNQIA